MEGFTSKLISSFTSYMVSLSPLIHIPTNIFQPLSIDALSYVNGSTGLGTNSINTQWPKYNIPNITTSNIITLALTQYHSKRIALTSENRSSCYF